MEILWLNIRASRIKQLLNIIRNLFAKRIAGFPILMVLFLCLFSMRQGYAQSPTVTGEDVDDSIKIGLLITEDPAEAPLMQEAVDVVNLVLDQTNESGGIREKQVKLFVKSVNGSWGTGSKRAVSLISEHGTTALLGFVDGRSAHLIEQVCTKAEIPFISTFSPDPTLSRINIPWFFSTMPHADQQAKVLADKISKNQNGKKVTVISSDDYDQNHLRRSFLQEIQKRNIHLPKVLTYSVDDENFIQFTREISDADPEHIVFFGSPNELKAIAFQLDDDNIKVPVYVPIMDLDENRINNSLHSLFTIKPKNWNLEKEKKFRESFYKRYGYQPGIYASYVYDGVIALLKAIQVNGAESFQIKEALVEMSHQGINGIISFDGTGMAKGELMIVNDK